MPSVREYPRLIAPKGDLEVLVWPEPRDLLRRTWDNHRQLTNATEAKLAGIPLTQLRRWMRRWLGHSDDNRPIIGTGHQTELYHPGVWVKNAAIDAAARRIGAQAIHFAVDTDAPKHLVYHWPGGGEPITDDPDLTKARWSGLLQSPSEQHVQRITAAAQTAAVGWKFAPAWDEFFGTFSSLAGKDVDLSSAIANAHHAADRDLGLRHQVMVCSPAWRTSGYLAFVYAICSNAAEFAGIYNKALADFRVRHEISSAGRPMPDLNVDANWCELPFWLDDLEENGRKRAGVMREGEQWTLHALDDVFTFDSAPQDGWAAADRLGGWLAQHKLRLSPRALTLTTFLRLMVVDQFVHGIGGALYDQVADDLIARWLGIEPPAFSVATGTMYFPDAVGRERLCLECLAREGRALRNGALGERKMQLVQQIAAAPRYSSDRARLFSQMHRELAEAAGQSTALAELVQRQEEARRRDEEDQRLFNRELPYTIQSRERLLEMIAKVDALFA